MKYRFYGDELQLIKYELSVHRNYGNEQRTSIFIAATESEKDELIAKYPNAVVTEIDNNGYEWLDGTVWTQEQLQNGELDAAIEMGESAYMELKNAPTTDDYLIDLDYRMSKLELGI